MRTEKVTVSLQSDTLRVADEKYAAFGFENRSEFIDAAIREYVSRDLLKQFSGELVQMYETIEHSEIRQMEEHLSKLSYKIAVELAQLYLLIASIEELPFDIDKRIRGKAVKLVNELKGYIPISAAAKNRETLSAVDE